MAKYFWVAFVFYIVGCKEAFVVTDNKIDKNDQYFSIAILPDIQYYTAEKHNGTMQMLDNQINWIINNRQKEKIAYVIQLGDITDHNTPIEWERAKTAMYKLEDNNIPYGLAVGNHDETPNGNSPRGDENTCYTKYFGKSHFINKNWYGGSFSSNNNSDDHFDTLSLNANKYLVLYFSFNQPGHEGYSEPYEQRIMLWADSVLTANADRKVILVAHSMLGKPKGSSSGEMPGKGANDVIANFTKQGKVVYNMAKHHSNVFLMLGGHIAGEGFRKDTFNGHVIKTYLSDYQSRQNPPYAGAKDRNGGNGTMRLMVFNHTRKTLSVLTFAPQHDGSVIKETDADSEFTQPLYK